MNNVDLEALIRHRSHLVASGFDQAEIETRLRDAFSADEIREMSDERLGNSWQGGPVLERLLGQSEALGQSEESLHDVYSLLTDECRVGLAGFGQAMGGGLAIFTITLSVACLLVWLMVSYVLPQIDSAFYLGGEQLPALTRSVFALGGLGPFLILVPIALVACVLLLYFSLRRMFALQHIPGAMLRNLPLVSGVVERWQAIATVAMYGRLRALGSTPDASAAACRNALAAKRPTALQERILGELQRSASLGTEDLELAHWQRHAGEAGLGLALGFLQRALSYLLILIAAIVVGTIVIAIYLPIFMLPGVI